MTGDGGQDSRASVRPLRAQPRVQILHVPDCPGLRPLRNLVEASLLQLGWDGTRIEEVEGPYPSPTLLIDGEPVGPRPEGDGPACLLDIPNADEIVTALTARGGSAPQNPKSSGGGHDDVRTTTERL